jgi:drug/metabolite transporter (DMT)-like permease
MTTDRRRALAALTTAGLAWGTTVPLSKLALGWLAPGWLTAARFGLAAAVLLAAASRSRVRAALTPRVLASGAIGYGGSVVLQNAGITRTSVTHAALLIGAAPVLVAIIAAVWHRRLARPVAWAGFAVSLAGAGLVTGGRGGGATAVGDALVLASLLLSATFTVAQGRLLRGRDPVAVTAVQFLGAALAVLPFAAVEGVPAAPNGPGAVLAAAGLAAGGTLLPFTLFAYGQARVPAELAGAFLNLEPLVGAAAGAIFFADPAGPAQVTGGVAIITGIALSSLPLLSGTRHGPHTGTAVPGGQLHRPAAAAANRPHPAQAPRGPARPNPVGHPRQQPRATRSNRHRHLAGRRSHTAGRRPERARCAMTLHSAIRAAWVGQLPQRPQPEQPHRRRDQRLAVPQRWLTHPADGNPDGHAPRRGDRHLARGRRGGDEGELECGEDGRAPCRLVGRCWQAVQQPCEQADDRTGGERPGDGVQLGIEERAGDLDGVEAGRLEVFGSGPGRIPDRLRIGPQQRPALGAGYHGGGQVGAVDSGDSGRC